jgi:16S rRNA (uracil1498-N3)-methyltransferase
VPDLSGSAVSRYPRVFVPPELIREGEVRFTGELLHHLRRVLRIRSGDCFLATDGEGCEYVVKFTAATGEPRGEILKSCPTTAESPLRIILVQSVPKGDLMGQVLRKSVELGVGEIWPIVTARTVTVMKSRSQKGRQERWQRIVEGAVAQSVRAGRPLLHETQTWEECLAGTVDVQLKLLLREGEERGLKEALGEIPALSSVLVAVGPEGGWQADEVEAAARAGFLAVGMGPRTLRTETAGLAALSVLQYLYGDLGHPAGRGGHTVLLPEDL